MSIGPRILGHATDLVFSGLFSRNLPAGTTQAEAVGGACAAGRGQARRHARPMDHIVPGQGVDFDAVAQRAARSCSRCTSVRRVLGWLQGLVLNRVVQNTVYRMRQDVEDKINRLPLNYFDRSPRGELLSRVTNDIDNVSHDPAADDEPADDLAADGRRRARDDVLDLATARRRRARLGPAVAAA